jgi:hypothetical protein
MLTLKDCNRAILDRLHDYLNNPETKYTPHDIWSDDYVEKRPWPFQEGTGRDGMCCTGRS